MGGENLKGLKVLFVEDDEVQRQELAGYLKRRVGKLYFASNGEEGLVKFRQCDPNLVLCDVRMPKMDGLKMVAELRKMDANIPILMLSALSDKETILSAVDLNITNYLIKPIELNKLEKALEQIAFEFERDNRGTSDHLNGELLDALKRLVIKYIKAESGKGPEDIRIRVTNRQVEIDIFGALTTLEKNMIKNENNVNMVNYLRNQFYSDRSEDLSCLISDHFDFKVNLLSFTTDSKLDVTYLCFNKVL